MNRFWQWLELHFSTPEFGGGLLLWLTIFFFGAATNTLSGWLYVISGVSIGLLLVGAVLPSRALVNIVVTRPRSEPVSSGDFLYLELWFKNEGKSACTLIQVLDRLPSGLCPTNCPTTTIEILLPGQAWRWQYSVPTSRRGIYELDRVELTTASPLGLFRSRRLRQLLRPVVVYPLILPLVCCPLLDRLGVEESPRPYTMDLNFQTATEGLTKNLRPYRWGDPMRLIHWRTSARYGELRIRELEVTTGGQEVIICLDTRSGWDDKAFEQAVISAASLYSYALKQNLRVSFWSGETDVLQGEQNVYSALAGITTTDRDFETPETCLVWLTHRSGSLAELPPGSCWIYWGENQPQTMQPGLFIGIEQEDKQLPIVLQNYPT